MTTKLRIRAGHAVRRQRPPRARPAVELLEKRNLLSINLVEREPNNTMPAANALARILDTQFIVSGQIPSPGDRDWFKVSLEAGDVIGSALSGQSGLDPAVRLVDSSGRLLVANDDANFFGNYLPPASPLPRDGSVATDAAFYYVIPA